MPSMWLTDFVLDLLTVRICFRKDLLILVRMEEKKKQPTTTLQQTFCPISKIKLTSCARLRSFLPCCGGACWVLHGWVPGWASGILRGRRGVVQAVPGEGAGCAGGIKRAALRICPLSTLPVVSTRGLGVTPEIFCGFSIDRAFIAPAKWNWCKLDKISLWILRRKFLCIFPKSLNFCGSGYSARFSQTGWGQLLLAGRKQAPAKWHCQHWLWLQSVLLIPLLLQVVFWTLQNIWKALMFCKHLAFLYL